MVSTLPVPQHFHSSDLSRNSTAVFDAATQHPVRVSRRNAEDFVLMTEAHAEAQRELLALAAQLIAISTETDGTLSDRMANHYPWMFALSPAERDECARSVLNAARASFSTQRPHLTMAELHSWRETAEAIAAGLGEVETEWLEDDIPVDLP
ncbi:prevent-host-death protein [Micrococcus lylae]|uniref:Prevent-host-death protein n=1 Tax=Micrococcus lylae TaxID=1273 RepID=A0ABY2K0A3_9MICC|nr:prevent-host-death protein [Micrococcus lylae]TFH98542.1 prevent-host-death protein [Micrococcus lylae]